MSCRPVLWSLMVLLICVVLPLPAVAEKKNGEAGIRAGVNLTESDRDHFEQYEAFGNFLLPWDHHWSSGAAFYSGVELTAGALRRHTTTSFIGAIGPDIAFTFFRDIASMGGGVNFALLSEHSFKRGDQKMVRELGGPFQFVVHGDVDIAFGDFVVGYRFQHMSNANLYNRNCGLNLTMISLGWRF